ncbi:MAG: hypothetical protein AAGA68_07750 [Pseudomonadota bacterium]
MLRTLAVPTWRTAQRSRCWTFSLAELFPAGGGDGSQGFVLNRVDEQNVAGTLLAPKAM